MEKLVLASASPRRRELLGLTPFDFEVVSRKAEEAIDSALTPWENVMRLAAQKARAIQADAAYADRILIGCDTVVALEGRILGKPRSEAHARDMLTALSGKTHTVYTGVCILRREQERCFFEATNVTLRSLTEREIAWYISTGEPMDKAGAYGIQGRASVFVSGIEGDYFNVVGLPLCRLYSELMALLA